MAKIITGTRRIAGHETLKDFFPLRDASGSNDRDEKTIECHDNGLGSFWKKTRVFGAWPDP